MAWAHLGQYNPWKWSVGPPESIGARQRAQTFVAGDPMPLGHQRSRGVRYSGWAACYLECMNYREIGRTGIKVSEIGFGCWTMGGPNWNLDTGAPIGWANVNEDDIVAGIKAGLDAGVNHWDNADVYGN